MLSSLVIGDNVINHSALALASPCFFKLMLLSLELLLQAFTAFVAFTALHSASCSWLAAGLLLARAVGCADAGGAVKACLSSSKEAAPGPSMATLCLGESFRWAVVEQEQRAQQHGRL